MTEKTQPSPCDEDAKSRPIDDAEAEKIVGGGNLEGYAKPAVPWSQLKNETPTGDSIA